jgi:3'(2'), 5'-bisphosphate nucleotidase
VDPSDDAAILVLFESLGLSAGRAIMDIFEAGFLHETKADASPVTEADKAAETDDSRRSSHRAGGRDLRG